MTPKQQVCARYPDAVIVARPVARPGFHVWSRGAGDPKVLAIILGTGRTPQFAWEDAAADLDARA